jgi:hypothetical protein
MSVKIEFIQETNSHNLETVFYTKVDGFYVVDSLSTIRDKAYEKFLNIASKKDLSPVTEVLETIYKLA